MSVNACCIKEQDFKCAFAGNTHAAHVDAPLEAGNIAAAKIWFTLRSSAGRVVLRRRNAAAGGDNGQVTITAAGGGGFVGKFDIPFPMGLTAGLDGDYAYEILMEITGSGFRQVIARGAWKICAVLSDVAA